MNSMSKKPYWKASDSTLELLSMSPGRLSFCLTLNSSRYYGWQDEPHSQTGILLARASHGSLQNYLEIHPEIPLPVQQKWCRQVAESISFLHENDVLHLDLRPDNFLVHQTSPESLDLWLCDFGGSKCEKLGVDGGHLPDPGFFDPNVEWVAAKSVDIFSVGSILYSIVTGHWPYRKPGPFTEEESLPEYDQRVEELFRRREFPNVNGLFCGDIVLGCWHGEYNSIDDVIRALDEEDSLDGVESVCEGGSDSYRQGRREQLERHREVVR